MPSRSKPVLKRVGALRRAWDVQREMGDLRYAAARAVKDVLKAEAVIEQLQDEVAYWRQMAERSRLVPLTADWRRDRWDAMHRDIA